MLASERPATPRAGGERRALQALLAARERAVNTGRAGLCRLRDLLITTPSHQGRITSEAAFARLAGAAPIAASSGQTIRYRLDRSGDRKLNRALHMILVTRKRTHPPTIAYIERRLAEGKTRREANRCLKRYLARNLYRLLEHPPATA